jgi:ABC-2 type transport system ATP-binding protein
VDQEADIDGRVRALVSVEGATDLRPEIFRLASQKGWTLYELYQPAGSLEDVFRELTSEPAAEATAEGAAA